MYQVGGTHGAGSGGAEVGEQVSSLHQLEDDELRVVVEADTEQPDDVVVLEVAHEQRLLEELVLLLLRRALP